MKVVFKLNPAQLAIAAGVKADVTERERRLEKELEEHSGTLGDHGNMLETTCSHPGLNQNFWLNLEGNLLSFEGERHPLQKDGALSVILEVFGDPGVASSAIVSYETSDKRLEWNETLEDYICHRATIDEVLKTIKEETRRNPWNPKRVYIRFARFGEVSNCRNAIKVHGPYSPRVSAAFDSRTITAAIILSRENVHSC